MTLLDVKDLQVRLPGQREPLLRGVNLSIDAGESLGLVGESGSGKSLTTRALMRLLPRGSETAGTVSYRDRDVLGFSPAQLRTWRTEEVAMIFQDPQAFINPVRTIGDYMRECLRGRYAGGREADRAISSMLRDVGISDPERRLRRYPHELSGGLLQRIMIASALLRRPRLLIADEPTTALDVTTQSDVMAIIAEQTRERELSLLFITHDLDLASAVCDRIAVMYAGSIVETATADQLVDRPAHPYTSALLSSRPELGHRRELHPIPGRPISGAEAPTGCAFAVRCASAMDQCHSHVPDTVEHEAGSVACHLWLPSDPGERTEAQ